MLVGEARVSSGLRIYAVGDIHGCLAELDSLLAMIDADLDQHPVPLHKLIFLGDYVDRGPQNRAVVERLIELQNSSRDCIFIKGNHDEKFAVFLEEPELIGKSFLDWGGDATIRDYGVNVRMHHSLKKISRRFRENVPESHVKFLKSLKTSHVEDDYFFCHAGVRPGVPLEKQSAHDLIWIRNDFIHHDEPFDKVIVHGHTIVDAPDVRSNRINVDTCCYGSGTLTSLVLEGSDYRFLQT